MLSKLFTAKLKPNQSIFGASDPKLIQDPFVTVYTNISWHLPWQKRVTDILIISSQWKPCVAIGIYLEVIVS